MKKKWIYYLLLSNLIIFFAFAMWSMNIKQAYIRIQEKNLEYESNKERKQKIYNINDISDWERLATLVNTGKSFEDYTIQLNRDLKFEDMVIPIGSLENPFAGDFQGNGHTISDAIILSTENAVGIFGCTQNSRIMDLNVKKASIGNSEGSGTGGIVGRALNGEIINCTFEGSVSAKEGSVGGIVGNNHAIISNCTVYGEITGGCSGAYKLNEGEVGNFGTGGIVGNNELYVELCENYAQVKKDIGVVEEGGIVGWNNGSISKCTNYGNNGSGGIAEYNNAYAQIKSCFNFGNVHSGIVITSHQDSIIERCVNLGDVSGKYKAGINSFWGNDDEEKGEGYIEGCILLKHTDAIRKEHSKCKKKNYVVHKLQKYEKKDIQLYLDSDSYTEAYNFLVGVEYKYRKKLGCSLILMNITVTFLIILIQWFKETLGNKKSYSAALKLVREDDLNQAVNVFFKIRDYKNSRELLTQLFEENIKNGIKDRRISLGRTENGQPILWDIFYEKKDTIALISKEALCTEIFNDSIYETKWKNSLLYKRLNGTYKKIWFNEKEVEIIVGDINIASINEVTNYLKDNLQIGSKIDYKMQNILSFNGYGYWWIRREDEESADRMPFVTAEGQISIKGKKNNSEGLLVRPVIHIKNMGE